MPSLRQIRYFLTVAEHGGFTPAADALFVAQPALSRQIAGLEAELGFSLFERLPRGVELTPAGRLYRERVQALEVELAAAARAGKSLERGEAGHLRLLHSSSLPVPYFLPWLRRLLTDAPDVQVDLDRVSSEQQIVELAAGRADVGLVRLPVLRRDAAVEWLPLPAERLHAALPVDHPLAAKPALMLAELAGFPFVSAVHRERGGLARQVTDLCLRRGFVPRLAQVVSRKTSMLDLVDAGLGVAVLPAGLAAMARPNTVCVPLGDTDAVAESALVLPVRATPLARRFAALVTAATVSG